VSRPWPSAKYWNQGHKENIPDLLIQQGLDRALEPQRKKLPAVLDLAHLARMSNTRADVLEAIVRRQSNPYRIYAIRKRNGRKRWLASPIGDLRIVQSWLHKHLLSLSPHPASYAFWPSSSILSAAECHVECEWLIKIDVEQFFDSISEIQVYHVFRQLSYPALVSFQMARLCTRILPVDQFAPGSIYGRFLYKNAYWKIKIQEGKDRYKRYSDPLHRIGSLPQGAPTSPLLAELTTIRLDNKLEGLSGKYQMTYTRYADDLIFSTPVKGFSREKASKFIKETYDCLLSHGLQPNRFKTTVVPPGSRKVVLGLLVDTERPRLKRDFRDKVKQHLYYSKRFGAQEHANRRGFDTVIGLRNHVFGLISYAKSIDPEWAQARLAEFHQVDWPL
jgi:RNA-directed DNA polymerase